jgi:hypothetical protein
MTTKDKNILLRAANLLALRFVADQADVSACIRQLQVLAETLPELPTELVIGQKVLLNGCVIGIVVRPEHLNFDPINYVWVFNPETNFASAYAKHNVKPLPNGQL